MGCLETLGRIPYASLIATVICCVGVGIFCGTLYKALTITLRDVFRDLFQLDITWLDTLQVLFVLIGVIMAVLAIILLVFGFLATGATRKNVYRGTRCIMGGRVSAGFFLVVSYILNLCWIGICSIMVVPVLMSFIMNSICAHYILENKRNSAECQRNDFKYQSERTSCYCVNLTHYGIFRNDTWGIKNDGICKNEQLQTFCNSVNDASPYFMAAYCGAVMIVLGMSMFMMCLSANYTRINVSRELTDYRDAVDTENTFELDGKIPFGTQ